MEAAKKARMTKDQQEYLLSTMLKHPEMINGNSQLDKNRRLWAETAATLNGMGVRKSVKEWLGTYKLFARKAKSKLRVWRASTMGTGGGPPADVKLNDFDNKVFAIEGLSTVFGLYGTVEAGISAAASPQPLADPIDRQMDFHESLVENAEVQQEPTHDVDEAVPDIIIVQVEPEKDEAREAPAFPGPGTTPRPARPPRAARVQLGTPAAPGEDPLLQAMREGAALQAEAIRHVGDCIASAANQIAQAYARAATTIADALANK